MGESEWRVERGGESGERKRVWGGVERECGEKAWRVVSVGCRERWCGEDYGWGKWKERTGGMGEKRGWREWLRDENKRGV